MKLNYLKYAFSERHLPIVRKKIHGDHDDQGGALITTAITDFFAHDCFHEVLFWVPPSVIPRSTLQVMGDGDSRVKPAAQQRLKRHTRRQHRTHDPGLELEPVLP